MRNYLAATAAAVILPAVMPTAAIILRTLSMSPLASGSPPRSSALTVRRTGPSARGEGAGRRSSPSSGGRQGEVQGRCPGSRPAENHR